MRPKEQRAVRQLGQGFDAGGQGARGQSIGRAGWRCRILSPSRWRPTCDPPVAALSRDLRRLLRLQPVDHRVHADAAPGWRRRPAAGQRDDADSHADAWHPALPLPGRAVFRLAGAGRPLRPPWPPADPAAFARGHHRLLRADRHGACQAEPRVARLIADHCGPGRGQCRNGAERDRRRRRPVGAQPLLWLRLYERQPGLHRRPAGGRQARRSGAGPLVRAGDAILGNPWAAAPHLARDARLVPRDPSARPPRRSGLRRGLGEPGRRGHRPSTAPTLPSQFPRLSSDLRLLPLLPHVSGRRVRLRRFPRSRSSSLGSGCRSYSPISG